MINKTLNFIEKFIPIKEAEAHCDVPCGIYDPSTAQIACLSVIRMIDLMIEHKDVQHTVDWHNKIGRYIAEKEKNAEIVKHEVRIIWGDFFKTAHFEKFPELHELTHNIMLLGSKARQEVNKEAALKLLDKVNRFAKIFWDAKGIETKRSVCMYAPSQEVVYPVL